MTALKIESALNMVSQELHRATALHAPLHSTHEGYGVLAEEFDELLEAIRANDGCKIAEEATQVAAMATRLIVDCIL